MNSLQAALPDTEPPSTFISGVSQQWFPPNPLGPLIPAAAQGWFFCDSRHSYLILH